MLLGWLQDETHPDLGPVHLQVNDGQEPVAHESMAFIDAHPLDVCSRRLAELPDIVPAVEWVDGRPAGLDVENDERSLRTRCYRCDSYHYEHPLDSS